MDFSEYNLKEASEAGSWVALEYNGVPCFKDEKRKEGAQRVHVRGRGDKGVRAAASSFHRLKTAAERKMDKAAEKNLEAILASYEEKEEAAARSMILAAVDGWENITWGGKDLEFNDENVIKLLGPQSVFFAQIADAIGDHERLFQKAATD